MAFILNSLNVGEENWRKKINFNMAAKGQCVASLQIALRAMIVFLTGFQQ